VKPISTSSITLKMKDFQNALINRHIQLQINQDLFL